MTTERTQVAIIGGGPAGLLLARMLDLAGIDCVILERQTMEYVMARIRAGVLEQGSVEILRSLGVGQRMDSEGFTHDGTHLAFAGRMIRIDFRALTDKAVTIYGQTEMTKDLYDVHARAGVPILDRAEDVALHDLTTDAPFVTYAREAERIPAQRDQGIGLGRQDAMLLRLLAGIDLDKATWTAIRPCHLGGKRGRQFLPIERGDDIE